MVITHYNENKIKPRRKLMPFTRVPPGVIYSSHITSHLSSLLTDHLYPNISFTAGVCIQTRILIHFVRSIIAIMFEGHRDDLRVLTSIYPVNNVEIFNLSLKP